MTEPYYSCGQCYIYTDYPIEYLMENELYCALPEREEYMMTCLYWRLAQYYFKQTPEEYPFYGPSDYSAKDLDMIIDYERAKLGSEEAMSDFLMKYRDIKPWEMNK